MALDEEDKENVLKQLTSFDINMHPNNQFIWAAFYYPTVMVPPKGQGDQEKWVKVNPLSKEIDTNITQPKYDGALCACYYCCHPYYCYAKSLPCCIAMAVVFAAILSILSTPLVLICFVPMIGKLYKARREYQTTGDALEAGKHWRKACQWPCFCLYIWTGVVAIPLLILLITVIVLVVVLNL